VSVSTPEPGQGHEKSPVRDQILYSVEQAARVLGLSPRLLWTFVASNELKTRRIGTRVLIHRRELEKFALHDHATQTENKEQTDV
jgi:excisionase family DNA binding protein